MKKAFSEIIIVLLSVLTTGCGEIRIVQENEQPLMKEDLWRSDFTEYGDARVRSINDICVIPEPLARRETFYNENGEITDIEEYEYDSENRYTQIHKLQRNPETNEMDLYFIYTYSYGDSFYCVDTTYVQENNTTTRDIYDMHGNAISTQRITSEDEEIETLTYTYEYTCDAKYKAEEYCYAGEDKDFGHHAMQLYNENGDETYKIVQYNDHWISTTTTEYEYNEQNQITHATCEFDFDISNLKTTIQEYTYTYDENGLLIEEIINTDEGDVSEYSQETIQYHYDEEGRLIREESRKIIYSDFDGSVLRESSWELVYEYDLDLDPIQQLQTVSKYPVTPATTAYRNLLEQDAFEWDEHGSLYDTSGFQFALINSDNEADTIYLLLQNKESYAAAGTQHLLVYRDGEIKTLWGYDQNCIYIKGFTKDKETGEQFYFIASGGRQDGTNFYVYQLEEDNLDLLAEYSSLERSFLDGSISESFYYWKEEEVSMQMFINYYNDLLGEELMEVTWIDNTEENRNLVFGNSRDA